MTSKFAHASVLLSETIDALQPTPGGRFIDATLGGGGHAEKVLELTSPTGTLLGIDADPAALAAAKLRLARFDDRAVLVEAYFDRMNEVARISGFQGVDGVLFDLGVSSPQLDTPDRGFSFQRDAPLDMRLGPTASQTAAHLVQTSSQAELQHIFQEYGEERHAGRVARRIVEERGSRPIETTLQLAELVRRAKPATRGERIHPATRVFQALRIAVNGELDRLRTSLPQAVNSLRIGGRFAVISFHSLEDRIVKQFMKMESTDCICPPDVPQCVCDHFAALRILTAKPLTASETEINANPRARSAKLRVAERISPDEDDSRNGRTRRSR